MGRPKGSKNKPKTTKTLVELAQDLVTYCVLNGGNKNVDLEVTVPQSLLDYESAKYPPVVDNLFRNLGIKLTVIGGTVVFNSPTNVASQVA